MQLFYTQLQKLYEMNQRCQIAVYIIYENPDKVKAK